MGTGAPAAIYIFVISCTLVWPQPRVGRVMVYVVCVCVWVLSVASATAAVEVVVAIIGGRRARSCGDGRGGVRGVGPVVVARAVVVTRLLVLVIVARLLMMVVVSRLPVVAIIVAVIVAVFRWRLGHLCLDVLLLLLFVRLQRAESSSDVQMWTGCGMITLTHTLLRLSDAAGSRNTDTDFVASLGSAIANWTGAV